MGMALPLVALPAAAVLLGVVAAHAVDVEIGPHADLSGANLNGANLTGANLTGADLTRAELWHADLTIARLQNADLWGAYLNGADLAGADLTEANLSGADLSGADLTDARLAGADLAGADLWYTNLTGADLTGADISYAILYHADLSGADLTLANLTNAGLYGADLSHADLRGADLRGADLSGADLRGADLSGADLSNTQLTNADLSGANLSHTDLFWADLSGADIKGIDPRDARNADTANFAGATVCDGMALPGAVQVPCPSAPAPEPEPTEPAPAPAPEPEPTEPAPAPAPEPEPSGFTVRDARYDWGANTLTLDFTGRVDIWNMDISRVSVSDGACAVSFTHGQLDIGRDRQSVTIRPDAEQRESLANMAGHGPYVLLRDGSFRGADADAAMEPVSIPLDMAGDHPYHGPKCVITYGYHDGLLGSYAHDHAQAAQAIRDGFTAWSDLNPYVEFRYVGDDPLIWVDFVDYEPGYIGLACVWCLDSEPSMEVILYDYDCKGGRIYYEPDYLRNTVAHELGHILGLDHHTDDTHLMYGPEYQVDPYEAYGYAVPYMLEEWYVGEEALYTHARSLEAELDRLEAELDRLEAELDRLEARGDLVGGTLYFDTQSQVNQYKRTYAEYDAAWDEYSMVWGEYDAAWDDLECMYDGDSPWHDDAPAVPDLP